VGLATEEGQLGDRREMVACSAGTGEVAEVHTAVEAGVEVGKIVVHSLDDSFGVVKGQVGELVAFEVVGDHAAAGVVADRDVEKLQQKLVIVQRLFSKWGTQ
jgi:hypothetical protein